MKKLCSLIVMLISVSSVLAVDAPAPGHDPEAMKAKMAEMMKAGTPSDGHKALSDLAGKFSYTLRWWQAAGAKPEESKGRSTSKWILGGRFLQQEATAKMKGMDGKDMKFEGMGITGYDNLRAEYQSIWVDNMTTGMMWTAGTLDAATRTVAQKGTASCPMTGDKNREFRTALKVTDKNHHTYEMFSKGEDGQEFKMMEIAYTRAK